MWWAKETDGVGSRQGHHFNPLLLYLNCSTRPPRLRTDFYNVINVDRAMVAMIFGKLIGHIKNTLAGVCVDVPPSVAVVSSSCK